MNTIRDLITNLSILSVFIVIAGQLFYNKEPNIIRTWRYKLAVGVVHGLFGIVLILFGAALDDRHVIDSRFVSILMSAYFGGPISSVITASMVIVFRTIQVPSLFVTVLCANMIIALGCGFISIKLRSHTRKWLYMLLFLTTVLVVDYVFVFNFPLQPYVAEHLAINLIGGSTTALLWRFFRRNRELARQMELLKNEYHEVLRLQPGLIYKVSVQSSRYLCTMMTGQLLESLGLKSEDIVGLYCDDIEALPRETITLLQVHYGKVLQTGEKSRFEVHIAGVELLVAIQPVFRDALVKELIVFFTDITERHKRILADEANQAKSQFLATMSHEIRTPLSGIIGLTQILMNTSLSSVQQEYLSKINSASNALHSIINDILDFSKIEAGKIELEHVPIQLDAFFGKLSDMTGLLIDNKPIEVLFDIADNCPGTIIGDPLRLEQIMLNLCGNAIKFTESGSIHIKAEVIDDAEAARRIRFSVQDTGIGILPEQLKQLFRPFSQADSSTTRKYGGTGLGLIICKHLVEMMGGTIDVASEKGQGSKFTFQLPLEQASELPLPAAAMFKELAGRRALLLGSRSLSTSHMRQLLLSMGMEVFVSEAWPNQPLHVDVDVVLVDASQPSLTTGLWTNLTKEARRRRIPSIIMATANVRNALLHTTIEELSSGGILLKPISRIRLYQRLVALLTHAAAPVLPEPISTNTVAAAAASRGARRVILAEDNEINQIIGIEILQSSGYYVEVANNGHEVLQLLEQSAWDAILMDIHMPEMDGCEATRRIRADKRFAYLPIIALTADAFAQNHDNYLKAGITDIVTKPIEKAVLMRMLNKYCGTAAAVDHV
ncbi:5TMR-LYT protein [Paenibacillus taihuensis]|uniref:Circadian input-output histidine kinase CikA n=1 Tax=Paenibacillus taihuensis TaxID=1156355 RepID=A0A3D9QUY3_9BACL|nr:ATP-binding protein [Paenibacillus taihuensis]REE68034.1 5TMR-LYT protein [Paenibacillus taihuensis]